MGAHDELLGHVESLHIVDTHEHLPGREERRPQNTDVLAEWLMHYFSCDLVSAGLPRQTLSLVRGRAGRVTNWCSGGGCTCGSAATGEIIGHEDLWMLMGALGEA